MRVIVGEYTPQLIEQLMRDRIDHLFVGSVLGGAAYAGPLVKPGKSPCIKCLEIGQAERYGIEDLLLWQLITEKFLLRSLIKLQGASCRRLCSSLIRVNVNSREHRCALTTQPLFIKSQSDLLGTHSVSANGIECLSTSKESPHGPN